MNRFSLCLNTSTIQPIPLLEKIQIAGSLGYEAIELWTDDIDAFLREGRSLDEVRLALDDSGLFVASVIALFDWTQADPQKYAIAREECRRRMDQATALKSRYIVASPPDEPIDLNFAADRYRDLLKLGREIGVSPSVEFLGFVQGVKTLASAKAIVDRSADSQATLVADVYHMIRGGGSIDDLLLCTGRQLAVFHINDLPTEPSPLVQTDHDRVMLGEGFVDLPRVIENLRKIDAHCVLSLELFNKTLWTQDPTEVCRIGLDRMKRLVEESCA